MSISLKSKEELKELQESLKRYPHIQEVHFAVNGDHYYNKHELLEAGKGTGRFYGRLKTEMKLYKVQGERKFFKNVTVETPEAEIVESLSREDILNYTPKKGKVTAE